MLQHTKKLQELLDEIRVSEIDQSKKDTEMEMKLFKAERGNETLQERIREKDEIIKDLKDVIQVLKGNKNKPEEIKK